MGVVCCETDSTSTGGKVLKPKTDIKKLTQKKADLGGTNQIAGSEVTRSSLVS